VFVERSRWNAMMCYDWPVADKARLCTDQTATPIWFYIVNSITIETFIRINRVVSMGQLNYRALETILNKANTTSSEKVSNKLNNASYDRVVAFQPTGWAHEGNSF
jgi:hypothetical protein